MRMVMVVAQVGIGVVGGDVEDGGDGGSGSGDNGLYTVRRSDQADNDGYGYGDGW